MMKSPRQNRSLSRLRVVMQLPNIAPQIPLTRLNVKGLDIYTWAAC